MNLPFFIAQRLNASSKHGDERIAMPAIKVAVMGIALGVAVMILATAVVVGFKYEIRQKVIGFGGHVSVSRYDANATYETQPITLPPQTIEKIGQIPHVRNVSPYITKPALIKTESAFEGIVLKGVDETFDNRFFVRNIVEGEFPQYTTGKISNEILVSKTIAQRMKLGVGDEIPVYFVSHDIRARKFKIAGIYATGFSDFDNLFLLGDIQVIRKLYGWSAGEVSGMEVLLDSFDDLDEVANDIHRITDNVFDNEGNAFYTRTIRENNPQIFSWLDLLDMNVWVILTLMVGVAGFNIISGLLILIIEKTQFIGILKSMGATNQTVRRIFLVQGMFLVRKGLLWGNLIGLALYGIQSAWHIVHLDASVYYLDYVPMRLSVWQWGGINLFAILLSALILLIPVQYVGRILPAKSIKFD